MLILYSLPVVKSDPSVVLWLLAGLKFNAVRSDLRRLEHPRADRAAFTGGADDGATRRLGEYFAVVSLADESGLSAPH
jgi:hypothetical protein